VSNSSIFFSDAHIPTIEDFHRKMYVIRGQTYQLDILDTAGAVISPLTQRLTLMSGKGFVKLADTVGELLQSNHQCP